MGRADLHVHSKKSPDAVSTPEEIVENCLAITMSVANGKGVIYERSIPPSVSDKIANASKVVRPETNCIALLNHNTIAGAEDVRKAAKEKGSDLFVITGEEISTGIENVKGTYVEVGGLYLKEGIAQGLNLEQTVREIKKQGGILYVPHPFDEKRHGVGSEIGRELIRIARELGVPIVWEIFDSRAGASNNRKSAGYFEDNCTTYNLLPGAGSDAHYPAEIGRAQLWLPDKTRVETPEQFIENLVRNRDGYHKHGGRYTGDDNSGTTARLRLLNRIHLHLPEGLADLISPLIYQKRAPN